MLFDIRLLKKKRQIFRKIGEAQIRVAVEVAEQFIALTGRSTEYVKYDGVINRDVLQKYQ